MSGTPGRGIPAPNIGAPNLRDVSTSRTLRLRDKDRQREENVQLRKWQHNWRYGEWQSARHCLRAVPHEVFLRATEDAALTPVRKREKCDEYECRVRRYLRAVACNVAELAALEARFPAQLRGVLLPFVVLGRGLLCCESADRSHVRCDVIDDGSQADDQFGGAAVPSRFFRFFRPAFSKSSSSLDTSSSAFSAASAGHKHRA